MQVFLLRHGIAEDPKSYGDDASRAITREGKKKVERVLFSAAHAGVRPELILTSPLQRARETAEIAAEVLAYEGEVETTATLGPGVPASEVWQLIRANRQRQSVLLVGHNPQLSELASTLIGAPGANLELRKGALMRIDFKTISARPNGILRWCLTASLTKGR